LLDNSIPYGEGRVLIIDIPIDPCGTHDIYIDDIIAINIDILGLNNAECGQIAALLTIDTTACRSHPKEPIP
jgi:hypothetical protein